MKQVFFKAIISLCIIGFFPSCHKDNQQNSGTLVIPKTALAYLQIPPGRIFAYKDSATGLIDSVRLLDYQITTEQQPDYVGWAGGMLGYEKTYPGYFYEKIEFRLVNLTDSSVWLDASTSNPWCIADHVTLSATGTLIGNFAATVFIYPADSRESFFILNLAVEGKMYKDVIKTGSAAYSEFYWAKDIGIIKVAAQNRTYTLCN